MCSCSLFFFSLPLIFTSVAASISHFFHGRYKISCFSSNEISLLCFFILSLPLALSLLSTSQRLHLTDKEVLTVLCSVVKHAGSGQRLKEVQGETREVVECFSLLLECSALILSDKEFVKLPTHRFLIFKTNFFPKQTRLPSACSTFS